MCARPIVVEIDDDYAKLGDPFRLIKLATCDRCYDLRIRRQNIEDAIYRACLGIIQAGIKPNKPTKPGEEPKTPAEKARFKESEDALKVLVTLTQAYALLASDWCNRSGMIWDEALPAAILEKPKFWRVILEDYWKTFNRVRREEQQEMATA